MRCHHLSQTNAHLRSLTLTYWDPILFALVVIAIAALRFPAFLKGKDEIHKHHQSQEEVNFIINSAQRHSVCVRLVVTVNVVNALRSVPCLSMEPSVEMPNSRMKSAPYLLTIGVQLLQWPGQHSSTRRYQVKQLERGATTQPLVSNGMEFQPFSSGFI